MLLKTVWHIKFSDRMSVSIYDAETVQKIVRKEMPQDSFVNGNVISVVRHTQIWSGSWDDGNRTFETIESVDVALETFRRC